MTELLDIAHKGRTGTVARIGGFPCGNTVAAGSGARFRASLRPEKALFAAAFGRH